MRCELFEDRPLLAGYPELRLHVPDLIIGRRSVTATLELDHTAGTIDCIGAGTVVMDRTGHGYTSSPGSFPVQLRGGRRTTIAVTLSPTGSDSTSHLYRVRAILLLNGHWFWASQTVIAGGFEIIP
jgi:hypothetical protein